MRERTILIVEDDKTLVDVLRYNLVKEGYRVVTAFDGGQALEVARRDKPDLIILDIMLPKIDGFEVYLLDGTFLGDVNLLRTLA